MTRPTPLLFPALLLATAVGLLGCGGKDKDDAGRTVVTGKLVDGNKPVALDASKIPLPKGAHAMPPGVTSALQVTFISAETKEPVTAEVNADAGTFAVKGHDGKGIKPGRYRIAIVARMGMSPDTPDYFKGRFTPEKTKVLRDIKPGDDLTIDVSKDEG